MTLFEVEDHDKVNFKRCTICDTYKHISEFPNHSRYKTGKDNRCKVCFKKHKTDARLARKSAPLKQTEECMICGCKTSRIFCDHDHKTGKFRGWICERCNYALGWFNDDPELFKNAIRYLQGEILNDYVQRNTSLLALYQTAFRGSG